VAVRLAGDGGLENAVAGEPDCYGAIPMPTGVGTKVSTLTWSY